VGFKAPVEKIGDLGRCPEADAELVGEFLDRRRSPRFAEYADGIEEYVKRRLGLLEDRAGDRREVVATCGAAPPQVRRLVDVGSKLASRRTLGTERRSAVCRATTAPEELQAVVVVSKEREEFLERGEGHSGGSLDWAAFFGSHVISNDTLVRLLEQFLLFR
jgi:hypothetical protein